MTLVPSAGSGVGRNGSLIVGMKPGNKRRVLVVGPGYGAMGGISVVIDNYRKSSFWPEFRCYHFSSIEDGSQTHKLFFSLRRLLLFLVTIIRARPAAVALHSSHGTSFYRKFCYLLAAHALHIPVILHIHPDYFYEFYRTGSRIRKAFVMYAARCSKKIVFLSAEQRDQFSGILPPEKLAVVSNPVDRQQYKLWRRSWRREPRQVLYLGWITREKGVYDLLEAIPAIRQEFPDVSVLFAGPKEVDKLRRLVEERGLSGSARALGWVEGLERLRLLRTSRLLVLPSYTEGVPNVLLEAMASRLAIVTTPVGGIPSILTDGLDCLMVQPGDVKGISAAICRLLRDDEECERLAAQGLSEVTGKYDVEVIAGKLRQIYRQVV